MNRIAPNNQLPATHFIEVYCASHETEDNDLKSIDFLQNDLKLTIAFGFTTIAIFRIRENKLPTKHKF
jgi:hypothetical protein